MDEPNLDQISPLITRLLLRTFTRLSLDKPTPATKDQEIVFLFLSLFGLHSLTLWDIFFPDRTELASELKEDIIVAGPVDFLAAGIITRSLYETFLIAHYLLDQGTQTDERNCRSLAWRLYGLRQRDRLRGYLRLSGSGGSDVSKDVRSILADLEANRYYKSLSQKAKSKLLSDGVSMRLEEIASEAGCPKAFHKYIQKQLSSFVHGDYHAFHQMVVADQKNMQNVAHQHFLFVSSLMLDLTRQHIFAHDIASDRTLTATINAGKQWVRDFDTIFAVRPPEK